jgi:sucrose phosphorylase
MMDQSMQDRLEYLYPGQSAEVHERLRLILDESSRQGANQQPPGPRYSESDIVLICYGDHVQREGERTLATLLPFVRQYVAPVFSHLHILPFFPYSSDDGFSVIDYYEVDERLGDWEDIREIAGAVGLMADLVINHVSAHSSWFQQFRAGDPAFAGYFIAFDDPVEVSAVFRPRTHPLLTEFDTEMGRRYLWTTFSADQIDVRFANPEVLLEYIRILLFYVQQGATVIRLDAIAYLWKVIGTPCIHLPQTHEVVKLLRQILDEVAPDVWIITETNVPHRDNISYFGNGHDEAHLVYNFALPPLLLHTLIAGDASALSDWARTLAPPSDDTTFFNFTASHDGIGVTPLRGLVPEKAVDAVVETVLARGGRVNYRTGSGQEPVPYELNIVYLDAVGGELPFLASQAIALALQGVPALYFNSLIGAQNWTEGVERLGYNRAINRQKFNLDQLVAELHDPAAMKQRINTALTGMIAARRAEPLFSPAAAQAVVDLDSRVFALLRSHGGGRLLALTNVSAETVTLDGTWIRGHLESSEPRDLLSGDEVPLSRDVSLPPYATLWLR